MKKKIISLAFALVLCTGLGLPASAAGTTSGIAARAIQHFEEFMKTPPKSMGSSFTKYMGYFYVDFDQDGVPEMVVAHTTDNYSEDVCASVFSYYEHPGNTSEYEINRCISGYPSDEDYGEQEYLWSSYGGSGFTATDLVQFSDGTYGLESMTTMSRGFEQPAYNSSQSAYYSGSATNQFLPTSGEGTSIYRFYNEYNGDSLPGVYEYFAKPTSMAYATSYPILIDGKKVNFSAYALRDENGNNTTYLRLRDVAHALNGTQAQFNVGWDTTSSSITLTTGMPYTTSNSSETSAPFSGDQPYSMSSSDVIIDGLFADLSAFTIKDASGGGYTYFKLRDLGTALGFGVDWDNTAKAVVINTEKQ